MLISSDKKLGESTWIETKWYDREVVWTLHYSLGVNISNIVVVDLYLPYSMVVDLYLWKGDLRFFFGRKTFIFGGLLKVPHFVNVAGGLLRVPHLVNGWIRISDENGSKCFFFGLLCFFFRWKGNMFGLTI